MINASNKIQFIVFGVIFDACHLLANNSIQPTNLIARDKEYIEFTN